MVAAKDEEDNQRHDNGKGRVIAPSIVRSNEITQSVTRIKKTPAISFIVTIYEFFNQ